MTEAAASSPLPRTIPDVDLLRLIGTGSYGEVWLARNRTTDQLLAAKLVRRDATSPRADRELTALRRFILHGPDLHDNLMRIYHVGQTEDWLFYLMELADNVDGTRASIASSYVPATLSNRLSRGTMTPEECLLRTQELLSGLATLHSAGLTHRDVKPANCLFVDGRLKLADFGLVAPNDRQATVVGTPSYMPPDGTMDNRADVFAAGIVLYEMLTGLPGESFPQWPSGLALNHARRDVRALNRLILASHGPDRFRDAMEMSAALQRELRSRLAIRRRLALGAALGVVLSITAVAVRMTWFATPQQVDVDFVTHPFEAEVYIDGALNVDSNGHPLPTPCTISALTAGKHRVVFKKHGLSDLDLGQVDFGTTRECSGTLMPAADK